jgi:hypothetical protein
MSAKLAVICLILLGILTYWGTIYQTHFGLDEAKKTIFDSWVFSAPMFINGVPTRPIPFVGAQLVMTVFLVNVSCSLGLFILILRNQLKAKQRNTWAIARMFSLVTLHSGLVVLLGGGAIIHATAVHSHISLEETATTDVSADYTKWELAIWKNEDPKLKDITAIVDTILTPGDTVQLPELGMSIEIDEYHANCSAQLADPGEQISTHININRIKELRPLKGNKKQPERNGPGGIFKIQRGETTHRVLLYGHELEPHILKLGALEYAVQLRKVRYPLPLSLTLDDVTRTLHPNTEQPKEYYSDVTIHTKGSTHKKHISMNNPLRHLDYTFYQSIFYIWGPL